MALPLLMVLPLALPAPAEAQLERLTVPSGAVRIEIGGAFQNLSSRINQGSTEDLLVDIAAQRGALRADGDINTGTFQVGLALGLTDRLTLFGVVPIVRQRVRALFVFPPAGAGGADTSLVSTSLTRVGDGAAGATFLLWNRWDRGTRLGGSRVAITAEVRFPTGIPANPEELVPAGTGGERTEIAALLTADVGRGVLGARLLGGYRRRAGRNVERFLPTGGGDGSIAVLSYSAGDIVELGARPFVRLAPALALEGGLVYTRTGADGYAYASAGEAVPGVDPNILAEGSAGSFWTIGVGFTYSSRGSSDQDSPRFPVEARWIYEGVFASSSGIVPKARRVVLELRVYARLWGR